ncbi:methyltransferase domain-containing protein [Rhodoplanes sp. SY1]|uniref:methyltransferase domain-containing protein n=1 Tax=Rhodoplanes sp. SY1 TaxID=3166646 RepID=UPI0038B678EE
MLDGNASNIVNQMTLPSVANESSRVVPSSISFPIHPSDYVFLYLKRLSNGNDEAAATKYMTSGEESASRLRKLYDEATGQRVGSPVNHIRILDFASGYGCVARSLRRHFPDAQLWCSDIHPQACEFIENSFGIDSILSTPDPENYKTELRFDFIFALSFFSHLPKHRFSSWLRKLSSMLDQNGIFLFTCHGLITHRDHLAHLSTDPSGFAFERASEQDDLPKSEYGQSVSYPSYVFNALDRVDELEVVYFCQGAWWGHQDVYIARRRNRPLPLRHRGKVGQLTSLLGPKTLRTAARIGIARIGSNSTTALVREQGIGGNLDVWLAHDAWAAQRPETEWMTAPFPPRSLMRKTSGLLENRDFSAHGVTILRVFNRLAPAPLPSLSSILDFGVGAGRIARVFKGYGGRYVGVDVSRKALAWVRRNLPWVETVKNENGKPIPVETEAMDCCFALSVFTDMTEDDFRFYVDELFRCVKKGGFVLFTTCGEKALARAHTDDRIRGMLGLSGEQVDRVTAEMNRSGFCFHEHAPATSGTRAIGQLFVTTEYILQTLNASPPSLKCVHAGAIHDFQDVTVLVKPTGPG